MENKDKCEIVSNILNGNSRQESMYIRIGEALGMKMDFDSDIFYEIEELIVEKYQEMQDEVDDYEETCGFCGNEINKNSIYCSRECSKADNTERV